jgi:Tol biopolymer transport system component
MDILGGSLDLSPDGGRVAFTRGVLGKSDIWVTDLARGITSPLTFDPNPEAGIGWSSDGRYIVYGTPQHGSRNIYRKAATGEGGAELLAKIDEEPDRLRPSLDLSRDGGFLLFSTRSNQKTGIDLAVIPLAGKREPVVLVADEGNQISPSFSHDMRWIAYTSYESGRPEIWVRPFVPPGSAAGTGKWRVSKDTGSQPRWRRDAREIFFRPNGPFTVIMAADVLPGPPFTTGAPHQLFQIPVPANVPWTVDAEGKRFLAAMPEVVNDVSAITVWLNWQGGLKQ